MALILYAATALALLALANRFVAPIPWRTGIVLFLLPLGLTGAALLTDGVYGPVDYLYQDLPFRALEPELSAAAPRNAAATDSFSQFFPWREAVRASLRRGEWPLWNAYNLCGHPLAAEAQAAPYSPFTLLACLLPAAVSLSYSVAMALFLAALLAFLLARELECGVEASLVAAAGWALSSCLVLYSHTAMGFATVYMPMLLLSARRAVRRPGMASAALLMVTLALCLLSGHPESLFLNVLVGCTYAVFELVRNRIAPWRPLLTALSAGVVAAALCAIALLPLLEAFPQSAEVGIKSDFAIRSQGLSAQRVLAAVARDLFPYLHVREWVEPRLGHIGAETAAAGSIVLAFAIFAVWRVRSAETWFFAALGLVCAGAGVRWRPVADTLQQIPLLHLTHHDRLAFAGALCLVFLAARGVDEILRCNDRRAAAITSSVVLVILAAGTFLLSRNVVLLPVTGGYGRYRVVAELLFLALAVVVMLAPLHQRTLGTALVLLLASQRLVSESDTFGTYSADMAWPNVALLEPLRHVQAPFRLVGQGSAFPPATNTFYGLEDPRGYEALTLSPFAEALRLWSVPHGTWYRRVDDLGAPFLSFLNVRFAIQGSAQPVPRGWRVVKTSADSALLENLQVVDRLFVPRSVVVGGASASEVIERMSGLQDYRDRAWILAPGDSTERANGPGRIQLRSRSLGGDYLFDAEMQNDGWVVLSDSSWKGWRATIDGKPARISRANAAFLSVQVPQGKHAVRIFYRPVSFVRGRMISLITLGSLLVAALFVRLRSARAARRFSA